jgi:hypothetical protein
MSHDVTRLPAEKVGEVTSSIKGVSRKKFIVTQQAKKSYVFMKPMIHYHTRSYTPPASM